MKQGYLASIVRGRYYKVPAGQEQSRIASIGSFKVLDSSEILKETASLQKYLLSVKPETACHRMVDCRPSTLSEVHVEKLRDLMPVPKEGY